LAARHPRHVVDFAAKDDDALNAELCAGEFTGVVFANLDALLTTIWKGQGQPDRWTAAGVRIELAEPPRENERWQSFLPEMYRSLAQWRRRQTRRKIVAASLLSLLALLALAILLLGMPLPR
jgi:hypothetical protein